jgi:hypothetical protein
MELFPLLNANLNNAKGFVIEPIYQYNTTKDFYIDAHIGYSSFTIDSIYYNMSSAVSDPFFKAGFGFNENNSKLFSLQAGIDFVFTFYKQSGSFVIPGNYFGNYKETIEQNSLIYYSLAPSLKGNLKITPAINIQLGVEYAFLLNYEEDLSYPEYYIPGFGRINNSNQIVNLCIAIQYRFIKNNK